MHERESEHLSSATSSSVSRQDVPSTRTARNPSFSLNLDKFYDNGGSPVVAEVTEQNTAPTRGAASIAKMNRARNHRKSRPAFLGESWFA